MTDDISKELATVKRKKLKIIIKLKKKPIKNTNESGIIEVDYIKSLSSLNSFFFYYFPHLDPPQIFVTDYKNNKYIARMEMLDTSIEFSNKYNTFETAYNDICNYGLQFLKKFVLETSIPRTYEFKKPLSKIFGENQLNSNPFLGDKKEIKCIEIGSIDSKSMNKNNFCSENSMKLVSKNEVVLKEEDKNFNKTDERNLKLNTLDNQKPKVNTSITDRVSEEKNRNKFHKENKEISSFDSTRTKSLEYSNLVKEICVSNRIQFPEYTIEKQNGVFICYASFFEREFISDYFFDKIQAKEDVNRLINEWIVSSKIIYNEKNKNPDKKDRRENENKKIISNTNQANTKKEIPYEYDIEMDLFKLINQTEESMNNKPRVELSTGVPYNIEHQQNHRNFSGKKYSCNQMKNQGSRRNKRRWFWMQRNGNNGNNEMSNRNHGSTKLYKTSELSSFWTSDSVYMNSQNVDFSTENNSFENINTNNDLYFQRNTDFNFKNYKNSDGVKYFENTFLENPYLQDNCVNQNTKINNFFKNSSESNDDTNFQNY
ncbi:hypothetical protein CWI39_1654p0010 [Hamiltosporidium magnivora]|uniref:Uncharacterized protein n=1 Tax=Hamiltosporidium magnivora TaxID=148818 RepID=A0A4V2JUK5_9MICR|nr:hypothetical protein CWI39_1654p0010 [Hamiltosporidium magnivora]